MIEIVWFRSIRGRRAAHAFQGEKRLCGGLPAPKEWEVAEIAATGRPYGEVCSTCATAVARLAK